SGHSGYPQPAVWQACDDPRNCVDTARINHFKIPTDRNRGRKCRPRNLNNPTTSIFCTRRRARKASACALARVFPLAAILLLVSSASSTLGANTENDFRGATNTSSVLTSSNWSLGHVPTVSEDAVFDSSSGGTGIRAMTTGNLTVGSWSVTATSG